MSLLDKSVVLLPPYATKSIYTVVKEFEHKGTAKVRLRHPETGSEHAKPVSQIRIAEDAEIAAGHRIEPHEAFQEWFKTQPFYSDLLIQFGDAIFDFERVDQSYRKLPVNIAWITWQQNSVEVYRLKLWYKNVKLQLENKEIDAVNDAKKIDELQKRVDELELAIKGAVTFVDLQIEATEQGREAAVGTKEKNWWSSKLLMLRPVRRVLEQALKGGAE